MNSKTLLIRIGALAAGSLAALTGMALAGRAGTRAKPAADPRPEAPPATAQASGEGHVPTDLIGNRRPGADNRAPDAFRPDPTAPVEPALREALAASHGA